MNSKRILILSKAFIGTAAIMLVASIGVTNILSLPIFIGLIFLFFAPIGFNQKRDVIISYITAAVIGFMAFLGGTQILHKYNLSTFEKIISLVTILAGAILIIQRMLEILYIKASQLSVMANANENKHFLFVKRYLIMVAFQVPIYLCYFPGSVISDSTHQILQAITGKYTNHHPVLQTWMIRVIYKIVSLFTTELNVTVAVFIAIQELLIALIFTYAVFTLYEMGVRKAVYNALFGFLAIMPYNVMMADNMWKDSFFSACLLLFVICEWRILHFDKQRDYVLLFLSGIIVCMFRNNGWYAFLLALPFGLIYFWRKKRKVCAVYVLVVVSSLLIRGPIFNAFNVEPPKITESLSIPVQQIANVISKKADLTDEEIEKISLIVDMDKVATDYDPQSYDYVKWLLNEKDNLQYLQDNALDYFKLWAKLGVRYPGMYLQAFVSQIEGYINPDVQRWQYTQGVWETDMSIYNNPLLPTFIRTGIKLYVSDWLYYIPILGMLKSIGFFAWLMITTMGFCAYRNNYHRLLLFIPVFACWLTLLMATPVYAEFRYVWWLFISMPFLIVFSLYPTNNQIYPKDVA